MLLPSTTRTSPTWYLLLKSIAAGLGQYLVLPLALVVMAVVTVHSVAVFGYEWQWALAKWGYPALCVAGLIALVQLGHWTVKSAIRFIVPVMILIASVGTAYKRGLDVNGPVAARVEAKTTIIQGQQVELDRRADEIASLKQQVSNAEKAASVAAEAARQAVASATCKPKIVRTRCPSPWDWLQ